MFHEFDRLVQSIRRVCWLRKYFVYQITSELFYSFRKNLRKEKAFVNTHRNEGARPPPSRRLRLDFRSPHNFPAPILVSPLTRFPNKICRHVTGGRAREIVVACRTFAWSYLPLTGKSLFTRVAGEGFLSNVARTATSLRSSRLSNYAHNGLLYSLKAAENFSHNKIHQSSFLPAE